jgi:hypothetical protein
MTACITNVPVGSSINEIYFRKKTCFSKSSPAKETLIAFCVYHSCGRFVMGISYGSFLVLGTARYRYIKKLSFWRVCNANSARMRVPARLIQQCRRY